MMAPPLDVCLSPLTAAVMQHRMVREAQKAMAPWMKGQPIYAPISSNMSSQGGPLLYPGEQQLHKSMAAFFVEGLHALFRCVCFG